MTLISNSLTRDILDYLDSPPKAPTLRYLNSLIHAYIRKVPWESVSRIIKRYATPERKNCPRLPEEFWRDAMQYGFGGTCFESSLAVYSLLMSLGYEGYLTVNDMGESRGCHAAIIILLHGQKFLSVVIVKVVNEKGQRFFGDQTPYKLESFDRAGRIEEFIEPENLPHFLAQFFQMPEDRIYSALLWTEIPQDKPHGQTLIRPLEESLP